jgi:RNA polymerase sigma-70 factor (ECF subfamily)
MNADTERRLVEQARHQPGAFRQLYQHYFPRVYAYVAYRVGCAADAEDVTAQVFLNVVEGLTGFDYRGDGAFAAWLFRIAQNAVNQFYRRAAEHISLDELPDIQSGDLSPDQMFARKEHFAQLRSRIDALSLRRAEIIRLKYFAGLRNQEIAVVLGLDERTVASHLSRALADLQRLYEKERADEREP